MAEINIELQEFQNDIKAKLRRAFSKIDEKRQGLVRKEVFFQILEVLDVKLTILENVALCGRFEKNGFIPYMEVIRAIMLS